VRQQPTAWLRCAIGWATGTAESTVDDKHRITDALDVPFPRPEYQNRLTTTRLPVGHQVNFVVLQRL
jgi:hypothetical protein